MMHMILIRIFFFIVLLKIDRDNILRQLLWAGGFFLVSQKTNILNILYWWT